ncbi:MAG: ferrous iron transport protein B, partial [Desulfobacterales bacterium]|nr:ferrous iron transport protein B [Desulfobacterales bacterium]
QEAIKLAESDPDEKEKRNVRYSREIENAILKLKTLIEEKAENKIHYNSRWTAIKLLEDDRIFRERFIGKAGKAGEEIIDEVQVLRKNLLVHYDEDPEIVMTDDRYGFIAGIIKEVQTISAKERVDISRNIDLVLTNRFIGFPIFIFFIWAMFQLTFTLGTYPMDWIESGVNFISSFAGKIVPESLLKDLLINGIIGGVGSVIVFLPNILILFFCIALFEDTGYMARAAFLMDKIMHLIGLHGKSFIPMLMGFGCNVPAIMAARTLESEKDRILTILITPFMSCSAKLPIYIVLAGTFFAAKAGNVIFSVYLLGILLSIMSGRLFRSTLLRGVDAPFVMELPPYRVPMIKSLLIHMWDRSKMFLRKMGGIILIGSVIVWTLSAFPRDIEYSADYFAKMNQINESFNIKITAAGEKDKEILKRERIETIGMIEKDMNSERAEKTYMGRIGKWISPVFEPLGIDWRGSVALLTGFFAKEIVVSTLGVLYAVEESDDRNALKNALLSSGMTPLSALSMMVFVLLYLPCLATIATIRKETGSFKWTAFSIVYSTSVAWIAAFCVFQGGKLLGFA